MGALIHAIGLPSRSGRQGSWGNAMSVIGFFLIILGGIIAGFTRSILEGLLVIFFGFLAATIINLYKK